MLIRKIHFLSILTLALLSGPFVAAQSADNTQLKQVMIFGRHGVRTPILPVSALIAFSVLPSPAFAVSGVAVLTPNGSTNETILGGYFRLWLTREGLLTGEDSAAGLLPAATVNVDSYAPPAGDPLSRPGELA